MRRGNDNLAVLIMAAGKGTRMKSEMAKVLHRLGGFPMIHYVVKTAKAIGADPIVVIVGHQKERVIEVLEGFSVRFAVQEPQLGTGHAVICALPQLDGYSGSVLILSGDVPLIRAETLKRLWDQHRSSAAAATVLTARAANPHGYGRIVRGQNNNLKAIVEERDATENIRKIDEINSGIYIFEADLLREVLPLLKDDNDQREYYLTDAVRLLVDKGSTVVAFRGNFKEIMGINTALELKRAGEFC